MNTHPFKRTHARILLYGILVVMVALGGCAAPAPQVVEKVETQVVEKIVEKPVVEEVELTFWAPALPEDDTKTIKRLDCSKGSGIKVAPGLPAACA